MKMKKDQKKNHKKQVKFSDEQECLRKTMILHNIITQSVDKERALQYNRVEGRCYDRAIDEIRQNIVEQSVCYAQQFSLQKGLEKFQKRQGCGSSGGITTPQEKLCFEPVCVKDLTRSE